MGLRGTIARRIIQAVVTILIALSIDFVFFHMLPGDPASLLSRNPNVSEVVQQQIRAEFGLDQPLPIQYYLFLVNFLSGNLGFSFHFEAPVQEIIYARLVNTLILILPATILSIIIGIYIGKKSAWARGGRKDVAGLVVSLVTYSIPSFWLSMFLIMLFSVNLGLFPLTPWIPSATAGDPLAYLSDMIAHLVLPWLVALGGFGGYALIMRNALLDVLSEDYMITAKAKGRTENDQLNKEAVPNAMIPVATIIALHLGFAVAGALQIEVVFSYPGIGRLLWDGILYRDYPLLQATFFMITIVVVFANLIADFLYYWLDPRIRVGTEFTISEGPSHRKSSVLGGLLVLLGCMFGYYSSVTSYLVGLVTSIAMFVLGLLLLRSHRKSSVLGGLLVLLGCMFGYYSSVTSYLVGLVTSIAMFVLGLLLLRRVLNAFRIALLTIAFLVLLLMPLVLAYPRFAVAGAAFLLVLTRWRSVVDLIANRMQSYSLSNLRYLWDQHRSRVLTHLSLLVLTIDLIVFIPIAYFGVYGLEWTWSWTTSLVGIGAFPPAGLADPVFLIISAIAHPAITQFSVLGAVLGWFIGRRRRTSGTLKQFSSNPIGIAGTLTVAVFVGMALFGDLLAPYDPQMHETGVPFTRPQSMPLEYTIPINAGVILIFGCTILWYYFRTKGYPSTPGYLKSSILGGLAIFLGCVFGYYSCITSYLVGLAASIAMVVLGLVSLARAIPVLRETFSFDSMKECSHQLLSLIGVITGVALLLGTSLVALQTLPNWHPLGTDQLGRDVFSQLVVGVRITLVIGLVATLITMSIGTLIGLFAGYYGGLADSTLMRFTDVFFVIPSLVIMIILGAILPASVYTLIFIIGIFSWPSTARIVRGQVLTVKERAYIERVRAVGGSNAYIMGRHVLPAVAPLVVANTVLVTAYAILSEVVLDFFGLGDPSMVSWGTMLYQAFGTGAMSSNLWWLVFPPGIMVILLLLGVSMVGYAMDDIVNPRLRRR